MKHDYIDVFEISESYRRPDSNRVEFSVSIDLRSFQSVTPDIVMAGIRDAVSDYVKENAAAKIYEGIEPTVAEHVVEVVKAAVEKRCLEIVANMDLDALVKLATIGAAKRVGASIGEP